jgi:7,8-dihydropterin-6-yl-methyl-4-(beta-D-ribofuranosyl)aminobenzene 5'-phosphate synthase
MTTPIPFEPVDSVEITTLYENLVDSTAPGEGIVERLSAKANNPVVSNLLVEERRTPFVGGHGLSMLMRITKGGVTRGVLFDAGGSPDGLMHNLDCLELKPNEWNCIVLSHGHWDHTLGLIGLQKRLGRLNVPLTLHPDAFLKRATVDRQGKVSRLGGTLSRQGLRDAGVELIESEKPSFVVERMALVTGQVERTNDFETGWPAHHAERNGQLEPDPLVCDDQGLVINLRGKGLIVLSGCGHAGIVNTVHHAQAITGVEKVHAVIGGFHLGPVFFHDRIRPVVDSLLALEPAIISPAHCAGHLASNAIFQARPDAFVQNMVGTRITMNAE